jgi:NlpC/P60 family putative phage cell wall peptidase
VTTGGMVVDEARRWIGTPYLHQASVVGAGTDCLGLLRGIWRTIYGNEPEAVPAYTADWAEPAREEVLLNAARRWLVEKTDDLAEIGDVLLFRMRDGSVAKHLGVLSETGPHSRFIHSYTGHGVIESSLSTPWLRRIVARFAFPEGTK